MSEVPMTDTTELVAEARELAKANNVHQQYYRQSIERLASALEASNRQISLLKEPGAPWLTASLESRVKAAAGSLEYYKELSELLREGVADIQANKDGWQAKTESMLKELTTLRELAELVDTTIRTKFEVEADADVIIETIRKATLPIGKAIEKWRTHARQPSSKEG